LFILLDRTPVVPGFTQQLSFLLVVEEVRYLPDQRPQRIGRCLVEESHESLDNLVRSHSALVVVGDVHAESCHFRRVAGTEEIRGSFEHGAVSCEAGTLLRSKGRKIADSDIMYGVYHRLRRGYS